jgi:hypothetical protein
MSGHTLKNAVCYLIGGLIDLPKEALHRLTPSLLRCLELDFDAYTYTTDLRKRYNPRTNLTHLAIADLMLNNNDKVYTSELIYTTNSKITCQERD